MPDHPSLGLRCPRRSARQQRACMLLSVLVVALCVHADPATTPSPSSPPPLLNNGDAVPNVSRDWIPRGVPSVEKRQSTIQDALSGSSAPTTSVALIILYSITGVITALFLMIIVTGAIRAHQHPERYGPRATARLGRPRQSRAKGLARAVLDTIPIVRFGALASTSEIEKSADVEMQNGDASPGLEHPPSTGNPELVVDGTVSVGSPNIGEIPSDADPVTATATEPTAEGLSTQNQCPVCMDDFEQGQEVRVLPCHHNFHTDCIDPWLLNVSGSCPLCRIDLHLKETPESPTDNPQPPSTPTPSVPEPTHHSSRMSRYLDLARGTSGDERMAALRQLREAGGPGTTQSRLRRSRIPELGLTRLSRALSRQRRPET